MDIFKPNKETKVIVSARNYDFQNDKRLLIPFTNGRDIGFINREMQIAVPAKYSAYNGDCFDEQDFIRVESPASKWGAYNKASVHFLKGIINWKGEEIFPCEYERIIPALGNRRYLFTFGKEYKGCAVMTTDKKVIVPFGKYTWIDGYDKGLARVKIGKVTNGLKESGAKWGLINEVGKEVLPVEYDDIDNFYNKDKFSIYITKGDDKTLVTIGGLIKNYQHYLKHRSSPAESYKDFNTFEEYSNTYAQREMGYSDEDIDDAFEGDPDAAWNVD